MSKPNGEREKRRFGPSGSQMSDDYWTVMQRFKIPPAKYPPERLDAETFKEMLEQEEKRGVASAIGREKVAKAMTRDLFFKVYNDPLAEQRRKNVSQKERLIQGALWAQKIELDVWTNEQMNILRELDKSNMVVRKSTYEVWKKYYLDRVKKAYKRVLEEHGKVKARAFLDFAYDYMQSKEPKDIQPFTKIIRGRARKLSLLMDFPAMRDFSEEMGAFLGNRPKEEPAKPVKRQRRKKSRGLPPGKSPVTKPDEDT